MHGAQYRANHGFDWVRIAVLLALLTVLCSSLHASGNTVVTLGSDVVIEQEVEVNTAVSIGGDVNVYGRVREDVISVGGSVFLGPYALIGGDVISLGGSVVKQEGAQVRGSITVIDTSQISSVFPLLKHRMFPHMPLFPKTYGLISFIGFLIIALAVVALIPETVGFISFNVEHNALKSFLWGILGAVLVLPVTIILIVSIVGIVLIPIEMILVACSFLLGYIAFLQLVGKRITLVLKRPNKPMLFETLIGSIFIWIIGFIPFFGWLVRSVGALLGLGGLIASIIARRVRATG